MSENTPSGETPKPKRKRRMSAWRKRALSRAAKKRWEALSPEIREQARQAARGRWEALPEAVKEQRREQGRRAARAQREALPEAEQERWRRQYRYLRVTTKEQKAELAGLPLEERDRRVEEIARQRWQERWDKMTPEEQAEKTQRAIARRQAAEASGNPATERIES
jgi:hypothetical protein